MVQSSSDIKNTEHAYQILRFGYSSLPIIAGSDKFFHILGDWSQYLAPIFPRTLGLDFNTFMMGVGVIEIIAGAITFLRPKIGGYIVAFWLWGITFNIILLGQFYDIALRDIGLSFGAIALAKLSQDK